MYFISGTPIVIATLFIIATTASNSALFLTPLIEGNKIEEARRASTVSPEDFLNITSYSGFLTVDKRYNSNLFFWYFPVSNKELSTTPWIIWLQGGPGATSLAGLFVEMGPLESDEVSHGLKKRQFSWCDEYSMVFIDNPVGAGYSFTDSNDGIPRNMEMYADNLYSAVKQLVQAYPELGKAPLYIAGESYAGRYVPALALKVLEGAKDDSSINLQGLIMGNPSLDRSSIVDYTSVFYNWGLVDAQGALAAKPLQEQYEQAIEKGDYQAAYDLRDKVLNKLQDIACKDDLYNVLKKNLGLDSFVPFITEPGIRESIHVGTIEFTFSNYSVHKQLIPDFMTPVSPKIEILLEHYRILIYCGQLDLTSPCVLNAEARRKKWRWSRRDEFLKAPRVPWTVTGEVAGYIKSGGGFTEVLVKGAGHLVPADKPMEAREVIYKFIKGESLRIPSNFRSSSEPLPNYEVYADLRTSEVLSERSALKAGLISSIVINVMLLIGIVVGAVTVMRWKRDHDYFNLPLNDDVLTMA